MMSRSSRGRASSGEVMTGSASCFESSDSSGLSNAKRLVLVRTMEYFSMPDMVKRLVRCCEFAKLVVVDEFGEEVRLSKYIYQRAQEALIYWKV